LSTLARDRRVLKPGQLNALARDLLEGAFAQVWVEGEISNLSRPASGHLYFTLKDERAQVRCALFRQNAMRLRFAPRDGAQVLARGRLTLYEARGDYQLVLEHLEESGEGALRRAFEELKAKLAAEGLFDEARKQPLPRFVRRLGVITSPSGAAVRDVLSVLARRWPLLEVEVLPVQVQGECAAAEITSMLRAAEASGRYDALLLTRGGGSLEDLFCFNDEALVRAVAACAVPIVAAIGHEVDFTLAEFAADLRAPTPSAAAERLVPDRIEIEAFASHAKRRLDSALFRRRESLAQRVDQAQLRLQSLRPQWRLERMRHRLDATRVRLDGALRSAAGDAVDALRDLARRLERQHPQARLPLARQQALSLRRRLDAAAAGMVGVRAGRTRELGRALAAVSPLATLARGFVIVRRPEGGPVVASAAEARVGERLEARWADGMRPVRIEPGEK
jgi:exodeoxyribonuclease VII large subunit